MCSDWTFLSHSSRATRDDTARLIPQQRARCAAVLPAVQKLLAQARGKGMLIVHTYTPNMERSDIAKEVGPAEGERVLTDRSKRDDIVANPGLPEDTRLWAALQSASGGMWGGCVYDPASILTALAAKSSLSS